jgi:hypothetical protein
MSAEMEVHKGEQIRGELVVGELANERTDGWIRVLQPVAELASQVAGTEFVPVAIRTKPAAITAAILFGRELDMPPMQALSQVHVVEGRPSLSAEHMRAMVLAAGHELSYDLSVPMQVTATGRRWIGRNAINGTPAYGSPTSVTWNIAMAERAGLVGKNNWKRHPRQMLEARATAELCRLIFADVTHGLPSVEELDDGDLYDESPADPSSPAPASGGTVSRRPRKGTTKPAGGPAPTPPVSGSVPSAPRPPLPSNKIAGSSPATGEPATAEPVGESTPGEGRASTSSTPADSAPELTSAFCELAGVEGAHPEHTFKRGRKQYRCVGYDVAPCGIEGDHGPKLEDGTPAGHFWSADYARHWCTGVELAAEHLSDREQAVADVPPEQCPATSHGHRCRYYEGHEGKHTYGGGMGDPVDARRCQIQKEHDSHAWNDRDGWHSCSGDLLEQDTNLMSEGDRSPDDVAATGTDEAYAEMEQAAEEVLDGEVVDDVVEGIHPGQKRALEAAFGSLGVKDRAEIHHACSAILGRRVETLNAISSSASGGLSADDGSKLLSALARINDRDELEALIQRAAEEWEANREA